jgi:hypothetical protein
MASHAARLRPKATIASGAVPDKTLSVGHCRLRHQRAHAHAAFKGPQSRQSLRSQTNMRAKTLTSLSEAEHWTDKCSVNVHRLRMNFELD